MATISDALALAVQHHRAGQSALADEICRRVLQVEPEQAQALHLLGVIALQAGRHPQAVDYLERAAQWQTTNAAFHHDLAEAYRALGRAPEATACYQRLLEIDPSHGETLVNLASLLMAQGQLDEAIACCRRAVEVYPDAPGARFNLAVVLQLRGRLDEALDWYQRTLELKPDHVDALCNLGAAWQSKGNPAQAVECFQRAVKWMPDNASAHRGQGVALAALGHRDEAMASYRRAIELKPDYAEAYNEAGGVWQSRGNPAEAVAWFWHAVELKPDLQVAYRNHLCALRYDPQIGPAELRRAYVEYGRRHATPFGPPWPPHDNSREPDRPLRVGFVSPRLACGPVGQFLVRALENLDRRQYPVVCYSDRPGGDQITTRLQATAAAWRDTPDMSDPQLAERIRADGIDLLFDLTGQAPGSRLLAFARKPAPVQITWIDSVGTTGLSAIDYIVADRHVIPPEAEPHYMERVLRMSDGYVCFDPPADAPSVGPLPAEQTGYVTFGSFNNPAKIHAGVVEFWAQILRRVPGSRLRLKYRDFDDHGTQRHYREWFAAHGVPADRLDFEGHSPESEYLRHYQQIDIALDPFPHTGGLTTCDALWMGVPVVTCPQQTFASRQSMSHLSNVGLTETIARDLPDYVERAVALAHDRPRLAAIRQSLRPQMAASPLCDGPRFAQHLMRLLRGAWHTWCSAAGAPGGPY